MKLVPCIATLLLCTLSTCQPSTERPSNGTTTLADTVGFAGFGFELLLAKIEQLEAKLQEQNSIQRQLDETSKLISTLQGRLDETQNTLQVRDALVGNLQQKLSQSEAQFRQVQDNLAKQVAQNAQLNQNVVENLKQIHNLNGYPSCRDAPDQTGPQKLRVGTQTVHGYCEQDDYGGGWLVIQRRASGGVGAENFNRSWVDYRNGFGSLDGDHWWGLEKVHLLTKGHVHELLVEVTDDFWGIRWAQWNRFQLGSEMKKYEIVLLEGCSGNGTCHGLEKKEPFNTYDRVSSESCEEMVREGGWWLMHFCRSNLNALIKTFEGSSNMMWYHSAVQSSRMMIRPKTLNVNKN